MNYIKVARLENKFQYYDALMQVIAGAKDNLESLSNEEIIMLAMENSRGHLNPHVFRQILEELQ